MILRTQLKYGALSRIQDVEVPNTLNFSYAPTVSQTQRSAYNLLSIQLIMIIWI